MESKKEKIEEVIKLMKAEFQLKSLVHDYDDDDQENRIDF